jgi:hypothetical protein
VEGKRLLPVVLVPRGLLKELLLVADPVLKPENGLKLLVVDAVVEGAKADPVDGLNEKADVVDGVVVENIDGVLDVKEGVLKRVLNDEDEADVAGAAVLKLKVGAAVVVVVPEDVPNDIDGKLNADVLLLDDDVPKELNILACVAVFEGNNENDEFVAEGVVV